MVSHRVAYSILMLFIGIFVLECYVYYPLLPDQVASHFDVSGKANGWSQKSSFIMSMGGVIMMISVFLPGITILLEKIPQYINLPNKEYWLAEERRETTIHLLSSYILSIGNTSVALLVLTVQLIFQSNIDKTANLGYAYLYIVCFFLLIIFSIVISMLLRFSTIEKK